MGRLLAAFFDFGFQAWLAILAATGFAGRD